jgi:hypothetical protein
MRRNPVAKMMGQIGDWKKNRTTMRPAVVFGSTLVIDNTRIEKIRAPAKEIKRTTRGGKKIQVAAKTTLPPTVVALAMMP